MDTTPPSTSAGTLSSDMPFLARRAKTTREYAPSYDWGASLLSDRHARIADAVWHIPGWLDPEDALKLYELAFFAGGPILEIGTYCGRSTVVLATAVADAARGIPVISVDTDPTCMVQARRAAEVHGVTAHVTLVCASAESLFAALPGFSPSLVFIDGDHSAAGVTADLAALEGRLAAGALLLFHDYLPRDIPDTTGFAVSAAPIEVAETLERSWVTDGCEFAGTFGRCGLFRVLA